MSWFSSKDSVQDFTCPHCGKTNRHRESSVGSIQRCKWCNSNYEVKEAVSQTNGCFAVGFKLFACVFGFLLFIGIIGSIRDRNNPPPPAPKPQPKDKVVAKPVPKPALKPVVQVPVVTPPKQEPPKVEPPKPAVMVEEVIPVDDKNWHTFTNKEGKTVEGRFVKMTNDIVTFEKKSDGKVYEVSKTDLIEDDIRWIRALPAIPKIKAPTVVAQPAKEAVTVAEPPKKDLQTERKELLQKLINLDVFVKMDGSRSTAKVILGNKWYGLDFEEKQKFSGVVYMYFFEQDDYGTVVFYNRFTGKEAGRFTKVSGLHLE